MTQADEVLKKTIIKTKSDIACMKMLSSHLTNVCQPRESADKLSIKNLFDEVFLSYTLRISFMFLVSCLCNFYMVLSVDKLGGNTLQNNAMMAGFDALGYLLLGVSLNTFGRVPHLTTTYILSGLLVAISSIVKFYGDPTRTSIIVLCNALGMHASCWWHENKKKTSTETQTFSVFWENVQLNELWCDVQLCNRALPNQHTNNWTRFHCINVTNRRNFSSPTQLIGSIRSASTVCYNW